MDDFVFNARMELTPVRRGEEMVAIEVVAPVRGGPLRVSTVAREEDPESFGVLARVVARGDGDVEVELDEGAWERLEEIGVLVPAGALSRVVRFGCSAFEAERAAVVPRGRLRVNETFRCEEQVEALLEAGSLIGRNAYPFADSSGWVRVEHAGAPLPSLYSLDGEEGAILQGLSAGGAVPEEVTEEQVAALAAAGVLVDPIEYAKVRSEQSEVRLEAAERLARDRWVVLPSLIHPFTLTALRRHYRDLVGEGHIPFGDAQVALRYGAYDEPLARVLLCQLTSLVSEMTGEAYKPSYAYFASYRGGATLAPHRDRDVCELSISLLVDYAPEPRGCSPWPLWLGVPGKAVAVEQGLGDGLLYRGRELTHYREALPEGHESTSLFLHYVPEGFPGSLM